MLLVFKYSRGPHGISQGADERVCGYEERKMLPEELSAQTVAENLENV